MNSTIPLLKTKRFSAQLVEGTVMIDDHRAQSTASLEEAEEGALTLSKKKLQKIRRAAAKLHPAYDDTGLIFPYIFESFTLPGSQVSPVFLSIPSLTNPDQVTIIDHAGRSYGNFNSSDEFRNYFSDGNDGDDYWGSPLTHPLSVHLTINDKTA